MHTNRFGTVAMRTLLAGAISIAAGHAQSVGSVSSAPTPSIIAVKSSVNPSAQGNPVTFTVAVSKASETTPSGTITLRDGVRVLTTATLDSTGTTTFTTGSLAVGDHLISAQYTGDASYTNGFSPYLTQAVTQSKPVTTTAISSVPNPATYGSAVDLRAAVTSVSSGTITGSVSFFDGDTSLGTAPLSSGVASLAVSDFGVGTHNLVARYSGDNTFAASASAPLAQTIEPAVTLTTLQPGTPNPSQPGQPVSFVVRVAPQNAALLAQLTGTVQLDDGPNPIGTQPFSSAGNTFPIVSLTAGVHTLRAVFTSGSGNFSGSTSSTVTQTVISAAPTSIALTSSENPATPGQPVTFKAQVTSAGPGTPAGTVTFLDGGSTLDTVALTGGAASFTTSALSSGSHSITASYSGGSAFQPSTSSPLNQVIGGLVTPRINLVVSPAVASLGQPVTFTATVLAPTGYPTPTGNITISNSTDGEVRYGNADLVNGVAVIRNSSIPAGSYVVVATYGGDGGSYYNGAQSNTATLTIQGLGGAPQPKAPSLSIEAVRTGQHGTRRYLGVVITNRGTSGVSAVTMRRIIVQSLAGPGNTRLTSPLEPVSLGDLPAGGSKVVPIEIAVDLTVRRLAVIGQVTCRDSKGSIYQFKARSVLSP